MTRVFCVLWNQFCTAVCVHHRQAESYLAAKNAAVIYLT